LRRRGVVTVGGHPIDIIADFVRRRRVESVACVEVTGLEASAEQDRVLFVLDDLMISLVQISN